MDSSKKKLTPDEQIARINGLVTPTAYDVLGIDRTTDLELIKESFRQLAIAVHPDKHPEYKGLKDNPAEKAFQRLLAAYKKLESVLTNKSTNTSNTKRTQRNPQNRKKEQELPKDPQVLLSGLKEAIKENKTELFAPYCKALKEANAIVPEQYFLDAASHEYGDARPILDAVLTTDPQISGESIKAAIRSTAREEYLSIILNHLPNRKDDFPLIALGIAIEKKNEDYTTKIAEKIAEIIKIPESYFIQAVGNYTSKEDQSDFDENKRIIFPGPDVPLALLRAIEASGEKISDKSLLAALKDRWGLEMVVPILEAIVRTKGHFSETALVKLMEHVTQSPEIVFTLYLQAGGARSDAVEGLARKHQVNLNHLEINKNKSAREKDQDEDLLQFSHFSRKQQRNNNSPPSDFSHNKMDKKS